MDWFSKLKEKVNRALSDIYEMPDEQLHAELKKYQSVPECTPDKCRGECQGMGWCDVATEFRNAIVPKFNNKPHKLGCDCKICKRKLKL